MRRDLELSGSVDESTIDPGRWTIGSTDMREELETLLRDLCEQPLQGEQTFRGDFLLSPYDHGYFATIIQSVPGWVDTLVPDSEKGEELGPRREVHARGEVVWDPAEGLYQLGYTPLITRLMTAAGELLGPYVGSADAVNLMCILQLDEGTGMDDLPPPFRIEPTEEQVDDMVGDGAVRADSAESVVEAVHAPVA